MSARYFFVSGGSGFFGTSCSHLTPASIASSRTSPTGESEQLVNATTPRTAIDARMSLRDIIAPVSRASATGRFRARRGTRHDPWFHDCAHDLSHNHRLLPEGACERDRPPALRCSLSYARTPRSDLSVPHRTRVGCEMDHTASGSGR